MAFSAIARTDGTFVFPQVMPGTYDVSFQGYVNTAVHHGADGGNGLGQRRFLIIAPGGVISGGVALSGIGEPLSSVVVQAVGTDGAEYSATTDSNGQLLGSRPCPPACTR